MDEGSENKVVYINLNVQKVDRNVGNSAGEIKSRMEELIKR